MRVYEVAKELGISSGDILERLGQMGYSLKSHMTVVPDRALDRLRGTGIASQRADNVTPRSAEQDVALPVVGLQRKATPLDRVALEVGRRASEVILLLLGWGIAATKNQTLPAELVERIAEHYGVALSLGATRADRLMLSVEGAKEMRAPIVVVLGHVDHGKTTLLDFLRKTSVAEGEAGGITQHLGAYEVRVPYEGKDHGLIFLDTPGHQVFSGLRRRGSSVADIAIILIAADDGVMPQTVESIEVAQGLQIPILVAINKIDRVDPERIEAVKRSLAQYNILFEEWGGDTICVPISAKDGKGVDSLLEMLVLQSQMMDLRTTSEGYGGGYVLESRLEKGRGPVATIILQRGKLRVGDFVIADDASGSITAIRDSLGRSLKEVQPSVPVVIAGFSQLPAPSARIRGVDRSEYRKVRTEIRKARPQVSTSSLGKISLILKADTNLSREALMDAVSVLSRETGFFNVIASSVGSITESDVEHAANTGAIIVGFNTGVDTKAASEIKQRDLEVYTSGIIYRLLERLEEKAKNELADVENAKSVGEVKVLRVFNIKGIGIVAGGRVEQGQVSPGYRIVALRGDKKVGEGKITSLQSNKKVVSEVKEGEECGIITSGFTGWRVGDIARCFKS